jgi:hypothetical protein
MDLFVPASQVAKRILNSTIRIKQKKGEKQSQEFLVDIIELLLERGEFTTLAALLAYLYDDEDNISRETLEIILPVIEPSKDQLKNYHFLTYKLLGKL